MFRTNFSYFRLYSDNAKLHNVVPSLRRNNSAFNMQNVSTKVTIEEELEQNTHIHITPPISNHNTVHSAEDITNSAITQRSPDDNSPMEKPRKTSFATAKFWFLKPGNIFSGNTGAGEGGYNPYHTIATATTETIRTSPSTARLTNLEKRSFRVKNKKSNVIKTPLPLPIKEQKRSSRVRTQSLCDSNPDSKHYDPLSNKLVKKVGEISELQATGPSRNSPKVRIQGDLPSNFETSEAVFRLQELFSPHL